MVVVAVIERKVPEWNLRHVEFGGREAHQSLCEQTIDGRRGETADKVANPVLAHLMSSVSPFFVVRIRPPSPSQRARARAAIVEPASGGTFVSSTLRPSAIVGCVRM